MGCCGDREKAITVTEEQKWEYIVRQKSSCALTLLANPRTDSFRLQIHVLPHSFLLRLVVDPCHHLRCRLRCRCIHRRQSPGLQQVVEPGETKGRLQHYQVDLCHLHYRLLCLLDLPLDSRNPRHPLGWCRRVLSGATCSHLAEHAADQGGPRMAPILSLCRIDQEQEGRGLHCPVRLFPIQR